jgi:hypothetical protein
VATDVGARCAAKYFLISALLVAYIGVFSPILSKHFSLWFFSLLVQQAIFITTLFCTVFYGS